MTWGDDITRLVEVCLRTYGRVDGLVNNVGLSMKGGPAEWDAQVDVNLKSVYLCCNRVLPLMEAQGHGVVINVSSVARLQNIGKL